VQELVRYLLENLYLDFQGDISVEKVREFLREDDSKEARQLLARLIEENGVNDMLLTLADCLKESIRTGISEKTVREQLAMYSDS
jgi:thioredoxin-like negative regulator of GroEL